MRIAPTLDLVTEQRLERRAIILQVARDTIAEVGHEAITVRDLALRCRVSVPTLYNQFGGRDQLLLTAIEEHFRLGEQLASKHNTQPGFERVLEIIDQSADELLNTSPYQKRLVEAYVCLESSILVQHHMATTLALLIQESLSVMLERRQLASWADPYLIAGQMTAANIATSMQWANGLVEPSIIKHYMCYSMGLALLGVVRGKYHIELEDRLQDAQEVVKGARLAVNLMSAGEDDGSEVNDIDPGKAVS